MWSNSQNPLSFDLQWQTYTPLLLGATDNPVPTYSTQIGRWTKVGNTVYFRFNIVTTTMTKTTLADSVQISLPITAASAFSGTIPFAARIENGTPVLNGNQGTIASGAAVAQFRNFPHNAASATIAYTSASLGVLTNTITFWGSGEYEV